MECNECGQKLPVPSSKLDRLYKLYELVPTDEDRQIIAREIRAIENGIINEY